MKRIITLVLSFAILMSSQVYVLAEKDYTNHWAYDAIETLVNENIITGDSSGNINPDANIKRCEFIKVINKTFRYENAGEENFPDISEDKWYSHEFKIAKKAGYITGDEKGNANPENYLTRAEAAVIFARVMKLPGEEIKSGFNDIIPAWAVGAVQALNEMGIINGYEDNTFRSSNNIKRCEVFSITCKVKNISDRPEKEEKEDNTKKDSPVGDVSGMQQTTVVPSANKGGGSSGGGGGGGGGSYAPAITKLNPPVIKQLDNLCLSWEFVPNAAYYEIKVTYNDNEKTAQSSDLQYDITEMAKQLTSALLEDKVSLQVCVKAVGFGNYISSEFTPALTCEYTVIDLENSEDIGVKLNFELSDNKENYILELPEGITNLTLKKEGDTIETANPGTSYNITDFISDDNGISIATYVISATNGEKTQIIVPDLKFGGGSGTEESPYIIGCKRHFDNISDITANYLQTYDITENVNPLEEFSGIYKGDGLKEIKINIENGGKYASLFGKLTDAVIENLSISGSISATDLYAASVAGEITNSKVSNCISNVDINVEGTSLANGAYSAGIAGIADENSLIEKCVNNGNITASSAMIAGIVAKTGSVVSECENNGVITATNLDLVGKASYVGGIVAQSTGISEITGCTNNANVENQYQSAQDKPNNTDQFDSYTGGIAGIAVNISECTNSSNAKISNPVITGTPKYVSGTQNIGGITGRIESNCTVSDCDNYGTVEFPVNLTLYWGGGIAGYSKGTITRCANYGSFSGRQFGGIVGRLLGTVSECFNTSDISSAGFAGGIAARIDAGCNIEFSYNTGDINGNYAGGFSGSAGSAEAKISNSYSAPKTACSKNAILGYAQDIKLSNVYYVQKGTETPGVNTDAISVSLADLNSEETINALNTVDSVMLDNPRFEIGNADFPLPCLINKKN